MPWNRIPARGPACYGGRMSRTAPIAAVLAVLLAAPVPARAAATDPELTLLYRLALSAEMCGFPVSPRQADAIGKAMDKRLAALKLSDDEADEAYRAIEAAMQAEDWDRLCAKDGAWAKAWAAEIRKFGR